MLLFLILISIPLKMRKPFTFIYKFCFKSSSVKKHTYIYIF